MSADVQPDASVDARSDGEVPADETARDAAGGEEVARAFETWRGEAVAGEEAQSSVAGEASRPLSAEEMSRPPVTGEAARSSVAADDARQTRGPVMPEPLAAQPSPAGDEVAPVGVDAEDEGAARSARLAGAVGATRRRAASVVKESIAPRVERVRDRSIVMLEEAPGDSGLRFVLIAAVMFALFIFLLVLSTVIK